MSLRLSASLSCLLALAACEPASAPSPPGISVRMDFARASFHDAPFPSDDLRRDDGTLALDAFPNPHRVATIRQSIALLGRDARGFGTTSGVFLSLTEPVQSPRLPSVQESVTDSARVFLIDVDPASADRGRRAPVHVDFELDGGPLGAPNMLSLLPVQGMPLRPATRYAAVVLRDVVEPALEPSESMRALLRGAQPQALSAAAAAAYLDALDALRESGIDASTVAGLSVFTTDAPMDGMRRVVDAMLAQPRPAPTAFQKTDTFDDYCVYAATIDMPDYQSGEPPFQASGGAWLFDDDGRPILQRMSTSRLVVTVPRAPMPADGWPGAVFVRTGGGGDRPLVDRGTQAAPGGAALEAGTGPALQFARAGFAGVQIDGPLGGLRNPQRMDEQFLIFNVFNGAALRDNVRESAAELVLLAHVLDTLSFDASDCDGASGTVRIDAATLAIMGHSMGASIAPLTMAFEPMYEAGVFSGAGASWIENVMYKTHPLDVRPAFELLLRYNNVRTLTPHDIALSIVQWTAEAADAQVYASRVVPEPDAGQAPRHVLMEQGIVDHYILPNIANALSVPLRLDLGGAALDESTPELSAQTPLSATFPLTGRSSIALPATLNYESVATAVVVQHREDGIQDGHEVVFQLDAPKYEYRCFLESLKHGAPVVLDGTGRSAADPCLFPE